MKEVKKNDGRMYWSKEYVTGNKTIDWSLIKIFIPCGNKGKFWYEEYSNWNGGLKYEYSITKSELYKLFPKLKTDGFIKQIKR